MTPGSSGSDTGSAAGDVTVYYDPLSYAAYDHPYEAYRELRARAPLYYNPLRNIWVISRYEDVKAALQNHEQLINAYGNDIDGTHDSYGVGMLVCQDPPRHTVLRNAIRRCFGGNEIMAMEAEIHTQSRRLIEELQERGSGDVIEDVVLPVVFDVSMRLVGIPRDEAPLFIDHFKRAMVRTVGKLGLSDDAAAANAQSEEHLAKIVATRRGEIQAGAEPGTDAIGQIVLAAEEGRVQEAEIVGLAHLVLSASTDAPAALVSNCIAALDKFPSLQRHLVDNPDKVANFVEEVLRFDPPAQNLARQTAADIEIGGGTIPTDSRVLLLMASANRDERVHESPDRFDVDRVFTEDNKILTFGEGIHSCMGAPLARLTARVVLEELIETMRDGTEFRIVGMPERWVKQMVRGFSRLPVEFRPGSQPVESLTGAVRHHATKLTLTGGHEELVLDARVDSKRIVAEGVVELRLRTLTGEDFPRWEAGAHIDLILDEAPTRQYSLCGDPDDHSTLRLGILLDRDGRGSSIHIHDRLSPGDVVRVAGPRNNFPLVPSPRYLFIAGGIGITPVLPMIRAAEAAGAEWSLVYGGRTRDSMAFAAELGAYGDRVSIKPQDETGLLDLDGLLGTPLERTKVYCCGPEGLLNAVEERCGSWPRGSLHVERFVPKPLTEPVLHEAFDVYLARSDLTVTVPLDKSILSAVREAGVSALSSCEEGTCGSCETAVISGTPDHRDSVLDADAREANNTMMICISRSASPRLVLDL